MSLYPPILGAGLQIHNAGVELARRQDYAQAAVWFRRAIEAGHETSNKALFASLLRTGAFVDACASARRYLNVQPFDFAFAEHFFAEIFAYAMAKRPDYVELPVATKPQLSFIVCSREESRFRQIHNQISLFARSYPHEIVRIADAKSMGEGYERGFARSRGDYVILCHDDIRFCVPDFFSRLVHALEHADMVGVSGATRMSGPAILFDGHPHLAGRVLSPAKSGHRICFCVSSLTRLRAPAHALDGMFIAARRECLNALGFDTTLHHFHYYDVDLSYRAHKAGMRVLIASDLTLLHLSQGVFGEDWQSAKAQFGRKFPELSGTAGKASHFYSMPLDDPSIVLSLSQAINEAMGGIGQ